MPNYCKGKLSIECAENVFEQIKNFVRSDTTIFDFDNIIPTPEYIYCGRLGPEEFKLYGKNNWFDWSNEFWGTKWNALDARLEGTEYYFDTAWSPCSPVIKVLAKHFPEATMRYTYYESGCCFCGVEEYKNGELVYTLRGNYYEYYDEDDCEEECPPVGNRIEDFTPIFQDGTKTSGDLYINDNCDDFWGYEIWATVSYEGKQPSSWWQAA